MGPAPPEMQVAIPRASVPLFSSIRAFIPVLAYQLHNMLKGVVSAQTLHHSQAFKRHRNDESERWAGDAPSTPFSSKLNGHQAGEAATEQASHGRWPPEREPPSLCKPACAPLPCLSQPFFCRRTSV
jgi:hypothetical protein